MHHKKLIFGILALIVVAGAVVMAVTRRTPEVPSNEPGLARQEASAVSALPAASPTVDRTLDATQYQWEFTQLAEDGQGIPQAKVTLVSSAGRRYEVGVFQGSCSQMTGDLLADERAGSMCWYAGGGHEIGIFEDGGKLVVKVGDLDEGTPEDGGFRGNFKTVVTLD